MSKTFPGNPAVIKALQAALVSEAHLNLQYRSYQRLLKFMGVKATSKKMNKFGDDAHYWMKQVSDQILFLGGDAQYSIPAIADPDPQTVTGLLSSALALETAIVQPYEDAIETARVSRDDVTRNLYEHLRKDHNHHLGWLMRQLNLIEGMGEPTYVSTKI